MKAPASVAQVFASRPEPVRLELSPDFAEKLGQAVWGEKFNPHHDARGRFAGGGGGASSLTRSAVFKRTGLNRAEYRKLNEDVAQVYFHKGEGSAEAKTLLNDISSSPRHDALYRGTFREGDTLKNVMRDYPVGKSFDLPIASTSKSKELALRYGSPVKGLAVKGTGIVFGARNSKGLDIDKISQYPGQQEVLISGRFHVNSRRVRDDGIVEIELS